MTRGFTWLLLFVLMLPLSRLLGQTTNAAASLETGSTPRIEWNQRTLTLIQTNGGYARIIRLKTGELLCGFDHRGRIWVRKSHDNGTTWESRVQVAEWPFGRLTNTELLQSQNGSVLCFYNERPHDQPADSKQTAPPFAIAMARSSDGGMTWHPAQRLYTAGTEFTNGCWEPAAVELPSDEVQLFFANEGPYRDSNEQEITLLRSKDNGHTWTSPERVSFRAGHRDGMPVPCVIKDRGMAFAIEDNGLSGNFKPVIVFSTFADNWSSGVREPGNTNRWSALRDLPRPKVAASAPYLRQMPSGETLLSFQRSDTGEIGDAYMVVCIGDGEAKNFTSASRPFAMSDGMQVWNSLFVKDNHTVIAVSQAHINGVYGIWMISGRFVR
jgi:hypothetical protein